MELWKTQFTKKDGKMDKIGLNLKVHQRFIVMNANVFFDQMSE